MARIILGLGSNLGRREGNLKRAVRELTAAGIRVLKVSRPTASAPAEGVGGGEFLNAALLAETDLEPEALLDLLQRTEARLGRPASHRPGEARTIDLDIIYYRDRRLETERLKLPHPRRLQRRFVLEPAAEVAPDFVDPELNLTLEEIARHENRQ
ncbi:MAG TPA: 2-amino-4-hydroxy-6-hydroxymethyldihydropteridine diphosphokinase [bacterium]|nr:2-amino-4-hydroxy-6-hydroxymethyldihydropteridine diphosphokinase [bacterium]